MTLSTYCRTVREFVYEYNIL